ncbi:hypothetical protein [Xanthomonas vesicatoria]|uniref:Uncharacterized protein n=2 Tax=Xanthomonas vesicatoria TaxID=56460 RepID=A0ABS8LG02_9XANT|nr:hypothetical protein [Xanthomonas vesicatoria]MCC8624677.1 hypothetical protein [Xanthomonas vesicatoria]MCC8696344.1 hypothetical protein [Xanthomonas vesicatoria]MCC8704727.1 hypothetical protein [Xanthomonas vesicatoria]MDG4489211.1 hypothetical protein [Xanthomonas vesicatoria]
MSPHDAVGSSWDFGEILDAMERGDYQLREIEKVDDQTAELRIDPHGYPYGGIGAFIALTEAYGMHVLGTNEYGKYDHMIFWSWRKARRQRSSGSSGGNSFHLANSFRPNPLCGSA